MFEFKSIASFKHLLLSDVKKPTIYSKNDWIIFIQNRGELIKMTKNHSVWPFISLFECY